MSALPTVTRLPSGLTIVSDAMAGVETVSVGVWVDVGTRNEPAEINGVAHLLEHMAFKGTERRSARDIAEEIENVGGHLNAYTSREHTAYYAKILKDDVPLAVDILADILQASRFDEEELERERTVILQEIGQAQDTPDDLIFDEFQEQAYPDQPMGRPVLGAADIVRTMPRDRVAAYMRDHYTADRMVVSAAGAIDHDRLVALIEPAFAGLQNRPAPPVEPARYQGGDRRMLDDLEQVHIVLGFPTCSYREPDYYTASVLATLVGGGMSSRLFQEIREKRGLVYSIYSYVSAFADGGLFSIYAGTGEKEIADLIPALCTSLIETADSLTEPEIARARAQIKSSLLMGLESSSSRAEHHANQLLIYRQPVSTEELVAKIDAVDQTSVARLARSLFTAPPTLAALGPISHLEPFEKIADRLKA